MIMMGGSTMILGTIILASSYSRAQLLIGRIVTGLGNGTYIPELEWFFTNRRQDLIAPQYLLINLSYLGQTTEACC